MLLVNYSINATESNSRNKPTNSQMQEIFQEKLIEWPTSATAGATRALKASGATRAPGLLVQNIASKVCKARSVQLNILHMDKCANVSRANKIMMILVIRMMMSEREKQHVEN